MSRGRAGVISKEYKGEENTEFHDYYVVYTGVQTSSEVFY